MMRGFEGLVNLLCATIAHHGGHREFDFHRRAGSRSRAMSFPLEELDEHVGVVNADEE
jgi:hypothetical protein